MSADGRRKLTPREAKDLWETRETWCVVEAYRDRKQKRVNTKRLESRLFGDYVPEIVNEERCTWKVSEEKHKERRHFKQQFESNLEM